MIFLANDSLSELVWSPHRGLRIRCTVGITISKSKENGNMTSVQSGQDRISGGSFESMNTALRVNHVEDDAVAVNTAIDRSSGQERNISPVDDKPECVAENDLQRPVMEVCEISKAAPITALALESKGKGKKVVSNDDLDKEASKDDDDDESYESVNSCNSARLASGGKKRGLSFNEQLIGKSKRLKMQVRETPGSSSFNRGNSSFSNWISTMVKGLKRPEEDEKKGTDVSSNKGFHSLFQSIYRPNPKVEDQGLLCTDDSYQRTESCKLLKLAENSGEGNSNLPVVSISDDKKDDHLSSLFISHFCPRPVTNSGQGKQVHMAKLDCDAGPSRLVRKNADIQGSSSEEATNSSSFRKPAFQSPDAMVSVFAKRLDAIKNIMPTEATDKSKTCFFCGLIGHDLQDCPQLTETEVDELLRNMAAYGGKEESPCLCIRCFQLNHWAIACPNLPSLKKNKVDNRSSGEIWYKKGYVRNLSLHVNLEMKENSESIGKASSNLREVNAYEFPWFPHPSGSLTMPNGVFEAVRSLRLSRTDVMKWMNSIFSASLDGFYLRLRQKKIGDGLGGTQYNVACICSSQEGTSTETSKGPIYITMGGTRCLVESQYISNQDFLEDELKAWWAATLRGERGRIPSEDELRLKVEERRRLGL